MKENYLAVNIHRVQVCLGRHLSWHFATLKLWRWSCDNRIFAFPINKWQAVKSVSANASEIAFRFGRGLTSSPQRCWWRMMEDIMSREDKEGMQTSLITIHPYFELPLTGSLWQRGFWRICLKSSHLHRNISLRTKYNNSSHVIRKVVKFWTISFVSWTSKTVEKDQICVYLFSQACLFFTQVLRSPSFPFKDRLARGDSIKKQV